MKYVPYDNVRNVDVLVGKILKSVKRIDEDEILFETQNGAEYLMYHRQHCCEGVYIEDISGDLSDLLDTPILVADERVGQEELGGPLSECDEESYTWTFYTFRTVKGTVDIRWYGSSNGYYSESVDFGLVE